MCTLNFHKHARLLSAAIEAKSAELVAVLVENGVKVNEVESVGFRFFRLMQGQQTALHLAVIKRLPDVVQLLIKHGARVNALNCVRRHAFANTSAWFHTPHARMLRWQRAFD